MRYQSSYKYDIFLSYAWIDNEVVDGETEGWVSRFFKALKTLLEKRIGDSDSVNIWWDKEMARNKRFDDEIKTAIENAAFFVTFGSNGYYASDYCRQELRWFAESCAKKPLAGSNDGRIFNVLINKKEYNEWPCECQGMNSYPMYEMKYERDRLGSPMNPGSEAFRTRITELADDIFESLSHLAAQAPAPAVAQTPLPNANDAPAADKPKVFVARTTDTLLKQKEQLVKELEANNIEVIPKEDIPPPYARDEHENAVKELLAEACLSVHLFDHVNGDLITRGQPDTFSQEQAVIAKAMAMDQLIFIPKELKFDDIKDLHHKTFLQQLQDNKQEADKYTLIREFALPNILHEIKVKIDESEKKKSNGGTWNASHTAILDFHDQDYEYAFSLANLLTENNIKTIFSKYRSDEDPSENIRNYKMQLKGTSALILICGKDIRDRVKQRLVVANETVMQEDCPVQSCAVYLVPKVSNSFPILNRSIFPIDYLDDSRNPCFNPETVRPFIQKIA